MSRKIELIDAAISVVLEKGVNKLTLTAVAKEANVSKGGLLYHYGTKDELIKAMNMHVIKEFRSLIEYHVHRGHTYHDAYLLGTLDTVKERLILFDITASLLAAITNNREVLNLWRAEYDFLDGKFLQEHYPEEHTLLVKAVCDGLWFSKLFDLAHMNHEDEIKLIGYIQNLLEKGDQ